MADVVEVEIASANNETGYTVGTGENGYVRYHELKDSDGDRIARRPATFSDTTAWSPIVAHEAATGAEMDGSGGVAMASGQDDTMMDHGAGDAKLIQSATMTELTQLNHQLEQAILDCLLETAAARRQEAFFVRVVN